MTFRQLTSQSDFFSGGPVPLTLAVGASFDRYVKSWDGGNHGSS